jgi:hypothetical protein
MVSRRIFTILLSAAVVLAVTALVAAGFGWLLTQGQDPAAAVLFYVAQGCGLLFVVTLICMVLSLAVNELTDSDERPPDEKS